VLVVVEVSGFFFLHDFDEVCQSDFPLFVLADFLVAVVDDFFAGVFKILEFLEGLGVSLYLFVQI